jgi:hypothetical protein
LTVALIAWSAAPSAAVDQLVPGRRLLLSVSASGNQRLLFSGLGAGITAPSSPADDPTLTGASLEVRAASGEFDTFSMPAGNWSKNAAGTVFRFKNPAAPGGPSEVRLAFLKNGMVKVTARSLGSITLNEPSQTRFGIVLNSGTTRYCAVFGGTVTRDQPNTFSARNAPPPASCPSPVVPTTTTLATTSTTVTPTTSTTSTTIISLLCGNSVLDGEEQCDPPGSACGGSLCNADCTCQCDFLDPSVCLHPFPNDYFTRSDPGTDTGRRVNFDITEMPKNAAMVPINPSDYNLQDGFSPGSSILLKVPGVDLDMTGAVPITDIERSLDAGAPIVIVNASTLDHHLFWAELDANATTDANRSLILRPGVNFEENTRYIVALRDMKDGTGTLITPNADFLKYRDNVPFTLPAESAKEARRAHFEDLFTTLADAGVPRANLYLAWDFTVASADNIAGRMLHIRNDAFGDLGSGVPTYVITQVENEVDSRIYRRITGQYFVPRYMSTPLPSSRFVLDANGLPVRQPGDQPASFICTIPRAALANAVAAAVPARASIYGHGLLGSNSEINAGNVKDMGNEHNFVFCATKWIGMADEDIGNAITILQNLANFPTLADRVQQGILNQLYLARLMIHANGFPADVNFQDVLGNSVIDPANVFFDGNSQGGIIGGALMAVAQDITRGVLGVPGMNYSTLLNRSVDFDVYATVLNPNYPNELQRPLLFALIQMLWDRAEANGYAHHMTDDPYPGTPAHQVLLHEAFGDHQVANVTTEIETRTIGGSIYQPALAPGRHSDVDPFFAIPAIASFPFNGSALVVWDSGTPTPPIENVPPRPPTYGTDPHGKPRAQATARQQKSEFLKPNGAVIDVCSGAPCLAP